MFGIIATIIAAKKRHYTFAWVVGIWTGIAFIFLLSGAESIAIAPGGLFLIIAIGMKKIPNGNELNTVSQPRQNTYNTLIETPHISVKPSETPETLGYSETQNIGFSSIRRTTPAPAAVRFCRYCGCELAPGAKFCSSCGARID